MTEFIRPAACDWITSCFPHDCVAAGDCQPPVKISEGPHGYSHSVRTNYSISVGGVSIPIVKTVRDFAVSYWRHWPYPDEDEIVYIFNGSDWGRVNCAPWVNEEEGEHGHGTVSDNCVIEKSTLHYLDQRYGVCLYQYRKDELHMLATSDAQLAQVKELFQIGKYNQFQIKTGNYTAQSEIQWRLVIGGITTVLSSEVTPLHPFGAMNNGLPSGEGLHPDYAPDPDTRRVLLFPELPSMGIPWSDVICRLGAYEFGYDTPEGVESEQNQQDGGNKDHYYPEWCRSLQEDPFWRAAADRRYQVSWLKSDITQSLQYTPPALSVDPIPRGSFVKHPQLGVAYQFLVGLDTVVTSPNLNEALDVALARAGLATHDKTLYYPISLT